MNEESNLGDIFSTTDLAQATAISLFQPILSIDKSNPSKVCFSFKRTDQLEKLVDAFWKGSLKVDPLAFSNQMKILKTRIYTSE